MKIKKNIVTYLAYVGFLVCADTSGAATVGFTRVTSNSPVDISSDLTLTVSDGAPATVHFSFTKGAFYDGYITQIYFEDSLSLLSSISFSVGLSSPGVLYDSPATPDHPPGVTPFTATISLDPDNPQPDNGISAGETGVFVGTLINPATLTDLEAAINDGTFRVALHAQGLLDGYSDTFINTSGFGSPIPPNHVPEPGVPMLTSIACIIMLARRVRH